MVKALRVPWSLSFGIRRTLVRMVGRLRAPGTFKFVAVFLPVSWRFAIMVEIRKLLVLFRGLHLLGLKIKDFHGLSF